MIDLQNLDLDNDIGEFVGRLSDLFMTPDNDNGAFSSDFCWKLEKMIVQAYAQHLKSLDEKCKKEFDANRYMEGYCLIPMTEAHELGLEFYAYYDRTESLLKGHDYSLMDEECIVKIYNDMNYVRGGFFYIHEKSLVAVYEHDYKVSKGE